MVRSAVDISGLTLEQQDWLMMLSDDDLARLATTGPKACELAATGKRCGVVGLPRFEEHPTYEVSAREDQETPLILGVPSRKAFDRPRLAKRIVAGKVAGYA
jgi:hypothetical protein